MILHVHPQSVTLGWPDGNTSEFDSLWLVDNSPQHRHAHSNQRLIDVLDLPAAPRISSARLLNDLLLVQWEHQSAETSFPLSWLQENDPNAKRATGPEIAHWPVPAPRSQDFCWSRYPRFTADPNHRRHWLQRLSRDGIAFLQEVPTVEATVLEVASSFGIVLETNYGRLFDVRFNPDPENLADSDTGLGLHTDNPYRHPVPGFQALHAIRAAPVGGESIFADGFSVAETIRQTSPDQFHLLCSVPVPFRYSARHAELNARRPFISLNAVGSIEAIYYNNRSVAPLRLPLAELRSFYSAYREFAGTLTSPQFQFRVALSTGDLVVFDNWRILHGRSNFASQIHARHLQGCYLTRDSVLSSIELISRDPFQEPL